MTELFDKYASWKILHYFALNSSKEVYVKEIAKKLNLSPGIYRCLAMQTDFSPETSSGSETI
ncbi:MAG: hypothetical protein COW37_04580 [Caldiserica bacterium CG17_big_fil_post_rev_8_21_14_2_50_35_7]|nr:MAG: hypothetical protein COW37_04580 [Caldiserica bacterium CG17_big_fil_post_rev_8_21_14_2_50_35_7]